MAYDFSPFKNKARQIEEWFRKELTSIRTGRAAPAVLDTILVEAWGAKMPLKQVAGITIADAQTLLVVPWDASQTKAIEKAIASAPLGLSPASGEGGIRVIFPAVSTERRAALLKAAKAKWEEGRVSLRRLRDEVVRELDAAKRAGTMGEDDSFRSKKELEKHADAVGAVLDAAFSRKEKEINS